MKIIEIFAFDVRVKVHFIITTILIIIFLFPATVQPQSNVAQIDSIAALLPQLQGSEKIDALKNIVHLTQGAEMEKHYKWMLLEEARKQNDVEHEVWALTNLVGIYYSQFDTDSIFIIAEEAIPIARKHKSYARLFFIKHQLTRRYVWDGKILTAIRNA